MKKTICLITLATFMLSCNKKYCWKCTITHSGPIDTTMPKTKVVYGDAFCNKTKSEIRQIEGLTFESSDPEYSFDTYSNCVKK